MSDRLTALKEGLNERSILLVDDDPETVLFIREEFRKEGITTDLKTHLREAHSLLSDPGERKKIGLVLIDLQFIGQSFPTALTECFEQLGNGQTGANTGQALGYWLWGERRKNTSWPPYLYLSVNPALWHLAEESENQEFQMGGRVNERQLRTGFVGDKFARSGKEFCQWVEKGWIAWGELEKRPETV